MPGSPIEKPVRVYRADVWLAVLLFAAGACCAMVYSATWGGHAQFWQNVTFMQSLMWACGRGFENPRVSDVPGLDAFLNGDTDTFDCGCIPDDVEFLPRDTRGMSYDEIDAYHPQPDFHGFLAWQRYHVYLVWAVAFLWQVLGVSWSALTPLSGLLYGLSSLAIYGLFRLAAGRALAACCTLLLIVSPLHLEQAPHLRDYSKAPFILLALFLVGVLLRRRRSDAATLGLAGLCGALIGLGAGFRTDVLICVPIFPVMALLLFSGSLWETWRLRLGALAAFATGVAVFGFPVLLEVLREAGHFAHVAILGLLHYCDARLGVGSRVYELGDPFSDYYVLSMVQAYSDRISGWMPATRVMSAEYHEATQHFLRAYVSQFPADLLLRAYASVLRVLDELRVSAHDPAPAGITNAFLTWFYHAYAVIMHYVLLGGRYTAALALLFLAARNVRLACAALALLLYFAGYPAIQFTLRHAFHLEFVSLWAVALLLHASWQAARGRRDLWRAGATALIRPTVRAAAFTVVATAVVLVPLFLLRVYQTHRVRPMIDACATGALIPLETAAETLSDGSFLLRFPEITPDTGREAAPVTARYLVLRRRPGAAPVTATFLFRARDREHWDFTRTLELPGDSDAFTRQCFPVYVGPENVFEGVRMDAAAREAIEGAYLLADAAKIPLWLTLTLVENIPQVAYTQSLTR